MGKGAREPGSQREKRPKRRMAYLKMKIVVFLALLFTAGTVSHAEISSPKQTLLIERTHHSYSLGLFCEILEDRERRWTLKDVTSPELSRRFVRSVKDIPNFGYSKSLYWVRFSLENRLAEGKDFLLEVGYPHLDRFDLYFFAPGGKIQQKTGGRLIPFRSRELKHRNFLYRLTLEPGKPCTFYMLIDTESSVQVPLTLWDQLLFTEETGHENFGFGLYFGIMLVMAFYNLFLFLFVRDRNYLLYVLYILSYILVQISFNGLSFEYLWPGLVWWNYRSIPFFIGLGSFFILMFSRSFLNTRENAPGIHKFLTGLIVLSAAVSGMALLGGYRESMMLGLFLMILEAVGVFVAGIACLVINYRPSRYFVIAWSAFLCGIITISLKTYGILPSVFITNYAIQIGSAMEVILLSLALADRINIMRQEKEEIQKIAIENLRKSDRLKDEFLANTSHELRTPLTGIIGLAESLLDGASGPLNGGVRDNLTLIVASGRRLSSLVNDVLDFSKLKNSDLELRKKAVDLRQIGRAHV